MNRANRGMNLTQQVADSLGNAIINGTYGEHNPVPSEAVLCQQLQVSRSAAREAVKSLAAKGLITSRARQGIKVLPESEWNLFDADVLRWMRDSNPSLELLREFTQLRVAIEPDAARLAAQHQDSEKIAEIAEALVRMKNAETGMDDPLESDIAFHLSVLNASGNRFFSQLGRIIDTTLRVSIRFTNMRTGVNAGNHDDHKKIYDAIVENQPEAAAKQAKKLMDSALATIVSALEERKK
ncbi:DNA-binding FadR family transcriptional regulator [Arenicella xantha]|uniref:DNA-binding FadR family transcriptional regulator n=1 Tax=Arenicella xantha TaxID=644221 RepID=A0A395JMW0_9GAMM|nr:FadR/GntR family transcriptional regulator [Arenicella xantha]RBP52807.1 DNA-binding FadR family transcriptional regulator [Arenicella xantha]